MFAFELELESHLKEPRRTGIASMKPVSETGRDLLVADAVADETAGRVLKRAACAASNHREPRIQEPHARLDVAAMVRAEGEHAGGDAVLHGRP